MRNIQRLIAPALLAMAVTPLAAQRAAPTGTIVYAEGQEPTLPLPVVGHGQGNADVADQLFLRLGVLKAPYRTTGDDALAPMLASSWRRIDPLTLEFTIDRRARWQDGAPVTAHDVLFTWSLEKNPLLNPDQADLERIRSVTAPSPQTVRVTFTQPFGDQLYLVGFGLQPLPAHLLASMPAESIATSAYAAHPVGDGPFRFARRVPGQYVELDGDSSFFLGRPTITRLLYRFVADPAARLNLFLSGETDLLDNIDPPTADRIQTHPEFRFVAAPSSLLVYALFNTRSASDTSQPNPFLRDVRVREALTLALDRTTMARGAFGAATRVPDAAQSQAWGWITAGTTAPPRDDAAAAQRLLDQAGWSDHDGDGVRDKGGVPLHLTLIYPNTSTSRHAMALQAQQMWRRIGVAVDLETSDFSAYQARRKSGQWDLDVSAAFQDASPATLVQSWSCQAARTAGSSNVAHWCDPVFDSLVQAAITASDPVRGWRAALQRMAADHPAIFLAAPVDLVALSKRYDNVSILPVRPWLSMWQWRVRPGAALPRDH
jgi:peptide/nickel transport system substrate-binding protein